jgi:hypothetical protein
VKAQKTTMTMMARRIPAEPGPPVRIGRSFACVSFVSAYRGTASLASVVFGLMMGRGNGLVGPGDLFRFHSGLLVLLE